MLSLLFLMPVANKNKAYKAPKRKDKNINKLEDLISSSNGGKHNELWDGIKKLGEIINM